MGSELAIDTPQRMEGAEPGPRLTDLRDDSRVLKVVDLEEADAALAIAFVDNSGVGT